MKILMVCLGNICRSPLAEGILRSKLDRDFFVDSAGTGNWHVGKPPDKRSVAVGKKYGVDISQLKARQFKSTDFDEFDFIFVMDESNYEDIVSMTEREDHRSKVRLILGELNDIENTDVPDPYYGEEDGFENVYRLLDEATSELVRKLKANEVL